MDVVQILVGRALKARQCTLEGQAWYVNVRDGVHWIGGYRVRKLDTEGGKLINLLSVTDGICRCQFSA